MNNNCVIYTHITIIYIYIYIYKLYIKMLLQLYYTKLIIINNIIMNIHFIKTCMNSMILNAMILNMNNIKIFIVTYDPTISYCKYVCVCVCVCYSKLCAY